MSASLVQAGLPALMLLSLCSALNSAELPRLEPQTLATAFMHRSFPPIFTTNLSPAEALNVQSEYVRLLARELGPPAGYKVGLVTKTGQEKMGLKGPVRGVLLKGMLLPDKSEVSVQYAARPILEPDLIVRIKDDRINQAESAAEAAASIEDVIAFIELADGLVSTNQPMNGPILTALNVGARAGVLGDRRAFAQADDFVAQFPNMELVTRDGSGAELSRSRADGIMGGPLNALLWLVRDLRENGQKLGPGDLVSLGSPSPQIVPRAGQTFTLEYLGLPGGPMRVSVSFKP